MCEERKMFVNQQCGVVNSAPTTLSNLITPRVSHLRDESGVVNEAPAGGGRCVVKVDRVLLLCQPSPRTCPFHPRDKIGRRERGPYGRGEARSSLTEHY